MQDMEKELGRRFQILRKSRNLGINAPTARSLELKEYQQESGSARIAESNLLEKLTRYKNGKEKNKNNKSKNLSLLQV